MAFAVVPSAVGVSFGTAPAVAEPVVAAPAARTAGAQQASFLQVWNLAMGVLETHAALVTGHMAAPDLVQHVQVPHE